MRESAASLSRIFGESADLKAPQSLASQGGRREPSGLNYWSGHGAVESEAA